MFFDQVLAFDHVKKEIHLMVTADLTREKREGAYERAVKRLNRLEKRLASALPATEEEKACGQAEADGADPKATFLKAVEKTKEYIAAGDVFQCVLSQRFDCEPGVDAFEIYRALRIVNPSPYMYFLRFGLEERRSEEEAGGASHRGVFAGAAGAGAWARGGVSADCGDAAAQCG